MKTVKLITRWFDHSLKLRVSDEMAAIIAEKGIEAIREDLDRVALGYAQKYLSLYQVTKIRGYFGKDDSNYFDSVEIL